MTGDGDIDFNNGLRITGLTASPEVTWVSESGAFVGGVSGIPGLAASAPLLHQNAPNPFNPMTVISWELDADGPVGLEVYDVAGRLVRTLLAGERQQVGPGESRWYGRDDAGREVAAGVYLYRLRAGSVDLTRRMTLVR